MNQSDYKASLKEKLPPGNAFPAPEGSNTDLLLNGLAKEFSRIDTSIDKAITETNVITMSSPEMIALRFEEAGLPDPCLGDPKKNALRKFQVIGRWASRGGLYDETGEKIVYQCQSLNYLQYVCNSYGYTCEITEYAISGPSDPNNYHFKVDYVDSTFDYFRAGDDTADERVEQFEAGIGINCVIERYKPCHTVADYTLWGSAIDMIYKPNKIYDFSTGTLPSGITFTRGSTAVYVDSLGVIRSAAIDTPRFTYDPTRKYCKGLLIEGYGENHITRCYTLTNAFWTKTNLTESQSTTETPPNDTGLSYQVLETALTGNHRITALSGYSLDPTGTYTISTWVKGIGRDFCRLYLNASGGSLIGEFQLSTKTVTNCSTGTASGFYGKIVEYNDSWYRISVSGKPTTTAGTTINAIHISVLSAANTPSYTGDITKGLYIWGAQLEAGGSATSLIVSNSGVVGTREPDSAIVSDISSFYNATEGTIRADCFCDSNNAWANTNGMFKFYDAADEYSNYIQATFVTNLNMIYPEIADSVSGYVTFGGSGIVGTYYEDTNRVLLSYKANDAGLSVNGSDVMTDTSVTIPTINALKFGDDGNIPLNNSIMRLIYYPKKMTTAHLKEASKI